MDFAPSELLGLLQRLGIATLYHANTVQTSCTFLEKGCLISRGVVEDRGWKQTAQYTDAKDRQFGILYDLFLDVDDLHASLRRANLYGPVLINIDPKSLTLMGIQAVRVTRSNPSNWKLSTPDNERYLTTLADVGSALSGRGRWNNMLVLRQADPRGIPLALEGVLRGLVVDDPDITFTCRDGSQINDPFVHAEQQLIGHAKIGGLSSASIARRGIQRDAHHCTCEQNYANMRVADLQKNFCLI